jgi:REP element-mobilizing transposase RayT
MPRRARFLVGGYACHFLIRTNARSSILRKQADYKAFAQVMAEAHERVPLRIPVYCRIIGI